MTLALALEDAQKPLTRAIDRFPWEDKNLYADWLAQTYYYVRHSTRLLAAAAARFPYDARGNTLHHRFGTHMAEENKHELLCIHDLKVLGDSIEARPEHASTRMFYEPQYFKVEHQDPIVLFGYILPLEAIAPVQGKLVAEKVAAKFGPKCASFLKVHAEEDVSHLEKALAMLADVDDENQRLIIQNIEQTCYAYGALLEDIRRRRSDSPPKG
jgi:thiaminase